MICQESNKVKYIEKKHTIERLCTLHTLHLVCWLHDLHGLHIHGSTQTKGKTIITIND